MHRLSIIIIAKNEVGSIGQCLRSVDFADEVIVLDSGSTDGTPELAREMGAQVSQTADWPGFGPQKNRALDLATGDWVFSIDADERLTPGLRDEIRSAVREGAFDAYSVNRLSSYCGQYMRHSGWSPDRVVRLFRRETARFSDDLVHERVLPAGAVGQLHSRMLHESIADLDEVIDKVNRYSAAGAQAMLQRGTRGSLGKALGHGLWAFLRTYLLRRGFLDGQLGLALAISNAEGVYYRYAKLWMMQRKTGPAGPTLKSPPSGVNSLKDTETNAYENS